MFEMLYVVGAVVIAVGLWLGFRYWFRRKALAAQKLSKNKDVHDDIYPMW